ncbi:Nucleolar protein 16 [Microbotryomycetes sp. JL201]|nr:Nucleolar protein 16 [Microbotryomycetes sp. JL201]
MANPRQRRKTRSGNKLSQSKQSKRNQHKVIVKGPEVLVNSWDKHKTVRQNYAAMGLMPTMNPRQAGGLEPVENVPYAFKHRTEPTMQDMEQFDENASDEDQDQDEDERDERPTAASPPPPAAPQPKLEAGMARIIRDETGKVIKVILPGQDGHEVEQEIKSREERGDNNEDDDEKDDEEDDEEDDESVGDEPQQAAKHASAPQKDNKRKAEDGATPWGKPLATWAGEGSDESEPDTEDESDLRPGKQGIPLVAKRRKIKAKTAIVKELEDLASHEHKVVRHPSQLENEWLVSLVAKYGDDYARMGRDRKLNVWQKTAGEIKRAIAKAGGLEKVQADASA